MGINKIKDTSALINISIMLTIIIGSLLEQSGGKLAALGEVVVVILLAIVGKIIFHYLKLEEKQFIFLMSILNLFICLTIQTMYEKMDFISVENNTLVFLAYLLATILIACNKWKIDYEFIFPKMVLLTIIFLGCIGLFYFTSQNMFNFKYKFIISLIIAIATVVAIKLSDKWDKTMSNADILSDMAGVGCACTFLAALFADAVEFLSRWIAIFFPSCLYLFMVYIFWEKLKKMLGEFWTIIVVVYAIMMLSFPMVNIVQIYNSTITPYKIFIAILLAITACLLLVISDDNVRIVMENGKVKKSTKLNKFPEARMFIGNVAISFTIISILFDNFNVLDTLEEVKDFRGPIIIGVIWMIGAFLSVALSKLEKKVLEKYLSE